MIKITGKQDIKYIANIILGKTLDVVQLMSGTRKSRGRVEGGGRWDWLGWGGGMGRKCRQL